MPEGGCQVVGVPPDGCGEGFAWNDTGGCDPILPAETCSAGTMPMLGESACRKVGVATCGEGSKPDGKGGCTATLPEKRCDKGTMAIPGETTCHEVAPCGTAPWGEIPVDASTVHVDGAYVGADGDGSRAKPLRTIQAAIDKASPSAIVAVAAGTYAENLTVTKAVRLWGRCPAMVTVRGDATADAAIVVAAEKAEVHGLAVTGAVAGVITRAKAVVLDRLRIHDVGAFGVDVQSGSATLGRSLVEDNGKIGVGVDAATLEVMQTVVRGTKPAPDTMMFGRGIYAVSKATLTVRRTLVDRNHEHGIALFGSKATVEDSVVRETQPQVSDKQHGRGIYADSDFSTFLKSELVVRRTLLERNHEEAIAVIGSVATIEDTVLRETQPQLSNKLYGHGIYADGDTKKRSEVVVRRTLFERNHARGMTIVGSLVTIEDSIVRDTQPQGAGALYGHGIFVFADEFIKQRADVVIRRSLVEGNREAGISVFGSTATIEQTVVRDTQTSKGSSQGIYAAPFPVVKENAEIHVLRSIVERNYDAGIVLFGTVATVEATLVRDTLPRPDDKRSGRGISAEVDRETGQISELVVRRSVIERNNEVGIGVFASNATVEETVVRDTKVQASDGKFGDGVGANGFTVKSAYAPASLRVVRSQIARNPRAGVLLIGAKLVFERTRVTCHAFDIDYETFNVDQVESTIDDGGGNACGCASSAPCSALTGGLEAQIPAPSLPPKK